MDIKSANKTNYGVCKMRTVKMSELKIGMDTDYGIVVDVYEDVVDFVHSFEDFNDYLNDDRIDEIDVEQFSVEGFEDMPITVFGIAG